MSGLNLREVMGNAEGFSTIPEGTYEAVVERASAAATKSGKEKISIMFKLDGGPNDGRTVWNDFVISPESPTALGIFGRQIGAMLGDGWEATYGTSGEVAAAILAAKPNVVLTLKIEEYPKDSGNMRNAVKGIKRSSAGSGSPFAAPVAPAATATPSPAPEAPKSPF